MTPLNKTLGVLTCLCLLPACAPSPAAVCDKMIELAKKDGSEAMAKKAAEGRSECVTSLETAQEMQGSVEYGKSANCIMDAATFKDAIACQE